MCVCEEGWWWWWGVCLCIVCHVWDCLNVDVDICACVCVCEGERVCYVWECVSVCVCVFMCDCIVWNCVCVHAWICVRICIYVGQLHFPIALANPPSRPTDDTNPKVKVNALTKCISTSIE